MPCLLMGFIVPIDRELGQAATGFPVRREFPSQFFGPSLLVSVKEGSILRMTAESWEMEGVQYTASSLIACYCCYFT